MPRPIQGTNITSTNIIGTHTYLSGRNIDNLRAVGGFDDAQRDLAVRTDGIINNLPQDGSLQADELVRMERPDHKATLFPEEQALQPKLWKAIDLPAVPAPTAAALPTLQPLSSLVSVANSVPTTLDLSKGVAIVQLPAELQRLAQRIQLILNDDANPQTISVGDVRQLKADPSRFLPAERDQLPTMEAEIIKLLRLQPAPMSATVTVPVPGRTVTNLPMQGTARLDLVTEVSVDEQAQTFNGGLYSVDALNVHRSQFLEMTVPAGTTMIVMNLDGDGEQRLNPGLARISLNQGRHRVELWKNGQRLESAEVIVPALSATESVDLRKLTGAKLVAADGQPLERVEVLSRQNPGNPTVINSAWRKTTDTSPGTHRPLSAYTSFKTDLPTGVYQIPNGRGQLRVYGPQNVAVVDPNGAEWFLYPRQNGYVNYMDGAGAYQTQRFAALGQPGQPTGCVVVWVGSGTYERVGLGERIA